MISWLELLANYLAKIYSDTPVGHAARLNGLDLGKAREFCRLIRSRLDIRWDIMVVTNQPETEWDVALDVAIERRNDKSKSRLFIIPTNLVAEAAASLSDTEAHEVTDYLRPIIDRLLRKLPLELRELAQEAFKRKGASERLEYLCALPESPNLKDCGLELWRLGLIPDSSPKIDRLYQNRDCVAKLANPLKAGASIYQRVESTGLADGEVKQNVIRLIRQTQAMNPQEWLQKITREPELGLTFDYWTFPERDKVNLRTIEIHSFIDSKRNRAYAWSGLTLEDQTLKGSATESKAKVTVRWSTEPEYPAGSPLYEITLETSDPQSVSLLNETQKHKASKIQSWNFRPSEIEGIEGGSLRVRVIIRSYIDDLRDWVTGESEEFLLISEVVETQSSSTYPLTRSIPDFLLDRAWATKTSPKVTWCIVESGSGVKIELDERQRRRITLNPVLQTAERKMLEDPNKGGIMFLKLSQETRWTSEDLEWCPYEIDLQSVGSSEWWRTRRRLFKEISESRANCGVVEACELSEHAEDILSYCRGYANTVEELIETKNKDPIKYQILNTLIYLDTIQLLQTEGTKNNEKGGFLGVLVSPLHPIRLLWHLAYEMLIKEWIRQTSDPSIKAILPKPAIAMQIDGGNCPVFLSDKQTLFYNIDSPFFHWPLYISAKEENPHSIASLVRWGLGVGTLETLTIGQEVAAEVLANRLFAYIELHPYVRTLKVNAVNVGDGELLIKALNALEDLTLHEVGGEDSEIASSIQRRYEIRLYGTPPVYRIGMFLDECASQRRRGQGLPQKLDRLFRPGNNFLQPHLFWAKRELKEIEESIGKLPEEAHVSFITEYFGTDPTLTTEGNNEIGNSFSTYGLQIDLENNFIADENDLAWIRTAHFPEVSEITPHPADRRFSRELLRLHRLLMKAITCLLGGKNEDWPATKVPINPKQFNLFNRLHEASDWVLTVDRNLGVELFDSPIDSYGKLQENAKRYLIDYAPDKIGSSGQQLMISTSWTEEVSSLLRETLKEMFISPTDLACEEVLRMLKSLSGRLVMRLARYPDVAKEAVSLAVVRELLRGKGELDSAFLVPVDDHIPIFSAKGQEYIPSEARRPDLLIVRPRLDKKATLQIDFVEVKYRRHRYMAYDRNLWSDMLQTTRTGAETLSKNYFPSPSEKYLDLPIRRRQLKMVLAFYIRRAVRHGLLDQETGIKFLQWLNYFHRDDLSLQSTYRGFIYCPELNIEFENHTYDSITVTLIGREALPRYTPLNSLEPRSAPLSHSQKEEPVAPDHSDKLSPPSEARLKTSSILESKHEKVEIDREEIEILLGHESQKERPVYFRPSLRGNPHILIVGIPGMGKTTAVLNLAKTLANSGINPFVIDFHGDISRELQTFGGTNGCRVLNAAKGLPFNPLEVDKIRLTEERGWIVHCFEIAEILADIYPSFGELQIGILRDTLRQCYEAAGFLSSPHESTAPSFFEFWRCLLQKAETVRDIRKITTRLESIFHLELFKEKPDETFSLAELLSQVTVLDLHRLEIEENQRVAAAFFLQRLYRDMFTHLETTRLRNAVILDEAHRVAQLSLIPKMMQECRKYGILFILSSQRVEDFDQGVLDSAGNHLYLRVNHPDARRLAAYIGVGSRAGDYMQKLQNLPKYHALFRSEDYQPYVNLLLARP